MAKKQSPKKQEKSETKAQERKESASRKAGWMLRNI